MKYVQAILDWLFKVDREPDDFGESNLPPVVLIVMVAMLFGVPFCFALLQH